MSYHKQRLGLAGDTRTWTPGPRGTQDGVSGQWFDTQGATKFVPDTPGGGSLSLSSILGKAGSILTNIFGGTPQVPSAMDYRYQQQPSASGFGGSTTKMVLIGGAALAAYLLFFRKKGEKR